MKKGHIDWCSVKSAYVTGKKSYAALALEMNISQGAIALRARKEKWGEARAAFRENVVGKVMEERAQSEAKGLAKLLDAAESVAGALSEALHDQEKLLHSFSSEGEDGAQEDRLDTRKIRALTGALKDMTQTLRNLYRLPTHAEEERLKLAREKFEYQKAQASEKVDNSLTVSMGDAEDYAK